jgi:hypothetical protein
MQTEHAVRGMRRTEEEEASYRMRICSSARELGASRIAWRSIHLVIIACFFKNAMNRQIEPGFRVTRTPETISREQ